MVSCNAAQCVKAWPSSTAMNHEYHRMPLHISSSTTSDIEGINSRLNTMSMEERAQGLDDLHGVASTPDETPEMLNTKLDEMNVSLSRSASSSSPDSLPYRTAVDMDSAYVDRLKIPCLRATNYKSKEAAALMIRFFGQKLELFGKEKLVRDLRLSDLDRPGEMEAFREKGLAQVLPHRDRSGRVVLLCVGRVNQQYDIEVVLRITLYFMMMACFQESNEETQKKGFVCLYFAFGQIQLPLSRALAFNKLLGSLPVKMVASHVCRHDDSNGNIFKVVLKYVTTEVMEKRRLCRWRSHIGTKMEVMYRLMTFGIIKETLLLTHNGELDLTNHHRMLDLIQKREEEEEAKNEVGNSIMKATASGNIQSKGNGTDDRGGKKGNNKSITTTTTTTQFVSIPDPMDILMGRGRQPTSSPGALTLRRVVDSYREKYDGGTSFEKQVIADIVLKQVKELGCRFLKETPGGYEECEDAVARSKISHGFRNARLRTRIKQQKEKRS